MARRNKIRATARRTRVERDDWFSDDDQQSAPPCRRIAVASGNKISRANTIETQSSQSPSRAVTASSPAAAAAFAAGTAAAAAAAAVTATATAPASASTSASGTASASVAGHRRRCEPSLTLTSHPPRPASSFSSSPPYPPVGMRASKPPAGAAKLADQPHRRHTQTTYDAEGDNEDTDEEDEEDEDEDEDEDGRVQANHTKVQPPPQRQPSRPSRSRSRSRRSIARIPMSRATSQAPPSRAPSRPSRRDDTTTSVRSASRPYRSVMTPDDSDEAAAPTSSGGEDTDDDDGGRQSRPRTKQTSTSLAKLRQRLASTSRAPPQAMATAHEIVYEDATEHGGSRYAPSATEDARSMSRPPVERRQELYRLSRSRRSSPDMSRSRSRSHGRALLRRFNNNSDGFESRPTSIRRASSTVGARMTPAHSRSSSIQRPSYLESLSYFGASLRAPTPPHKPTNVAACVICMDEKPSKHTVQLQCGHRMCHQCLKRKFELTVSDPQSHMPPRCCRQDQVIPPHHVERLFDSGFKTEWNRKFQEWTTRNRIYCPSRRCGEWIKPQNIRRSEEDPTRKLARCSACKTKVCCKCGGRWHRGRECPRDEETTKFLEQAKQEGWQRCHRCKSMVELKEGCNHMTCRCGAEFCMICASKWKTCDCPWFNFDAADNDHQDVHDVHDLHDLHDLRDLHDLHDHHVANVGIHDNPFVAGPRYGRHDTAAVPSSPPSPREFLQSEPGGFAPVRSARTRQYNYYDDDMLLRRMQGRRKSDGLPRRPPTFGAYDFERDQVDDADDADDDYTTTYDQATIHGHFMPPPADYPRRAGSVIVPPVSAAVLPPAPPPPSTVYGGPTSRTLDANPAGGLDYMAGIPRAARPLRSAYSPERRPRVVVPGPATVIASSSATPERLVRRPTVSAVPSMAQPSLDRVVDSRRWTTSLEQRLADRFAEKIRPGASAAGPINMLSPGVTPPPMPGMGPPPLSHSHSHSHSHPHPHPHPHARGLPPHVQQPMSVCGPVPPQPMSLPPMSPPHHMVSAMSPMAGPNPMAPLGIMPQPPTTAHPSSMMVGRPSIPPLRSPDPASALMMDNDTNAMMRMGFGPNMGGMMSPSSWTIGSRGGGGGVARSVAAVDMNRLTPRETATRRVFRENRRSAPEATKQSVLAGLGSQGTGMGRVCEWIAHVPLGAPDGGGDGQGRGQRIGMYETVAA